MARVTLKPCAQCKTLMASQKAVRRWPWLLDTYGRCSARGLCSRCYRRAQADGDLIDFERRTMSRDELLDEWELLRGEGYTIPQAAPRIGMNVDALCQALLRARREGDPRAKFTWSGVKRAVREQRQVS